MTASTYDVVVIGGGPVGENIVDRTRRAGLSTLLVERELIGGECSYWACVPSKTLLRPGALVAEARGVPEVADVLAGRPDPARTFRRRDYEVSDWSDSGQVSWLGSVDVDFVRGSARFVSPRVLEIEQDGGGQDDAGDDAGRDDAGRDGAARDGGNRVRVEVRYAVVVATGSEPVLPPVPGLAEAAPWTSRDATSAHEVPASLAVVGGGVVAVEMATAYADLGADVSMLVRGDRVLAAAEPFASDQVLASLRALGIRVETDVEVTEIRRDDGEVRVSFTRRDNPASGGHGDGGSAPGELRAAEILVATGRRPRTADLGLETIGLEPGRPLAVDDSLCVTAVPDGWLFAVGDVSGRTGTTHQGKYDARIAAEVIVARFAHRSAPDGDATGSDATGSDASEDQASWGRHRASADLVGAPQVVFSRPEVASVGLTLAAAEAKGLAVRAIDHDIASVSGAYLKADDYAGTARLVVDTDREVVVGATFTGPDAAELLHAATIAVVAEVPVSRLWHAVPSFPTVSEVWLRLLEDYGL